MLPIESLEKSVFSQINHNRFRNLFYCGDAVEPYFTAETSRLVDENRQLIRDLAEKGETGSWVDFMTRESLRSFYAMNQYIHASPQEVALLKLVYAALMKELGGTNTIEQVSTQHFQLLADWLQAVDPLLMSIYSGAGEKITPVVCENYSPDFLMSLYDLSFEQLSGPILDIGCGHDGRFVRFLREQQIDAHGFDRVVGAPESWLREADWFSYDFEPSAWSLILANQSLSLHFQHFHLREGDAVLPYARLYMKIIQSLKPDGSFVYAPAIPFFELVLPVNQYRLNRRLAFGRIEVTAITRIF